MNFSFVFFNQVYSLLFDTSIRVERHCATLSFTAEERLCHVSVFLANTVVDFFFFFFKVYSATDGSLRWPESQLLRIWLKCTCSSLPVSSEKEVNRQVSRQRTTVTWRFLISFRHINRHFFYWISVDITKKTVESLFFLKNWNQKTARLTDMRAWTSNSRHAWQSRLQIFSRRNLYPGY